MSKIHPLIHNAINLDGSIEKIKKFYDDWAETYEVDLDGAYIAPKFIVNYLLDVLKSAQIPLVHEGINPPAVLVYHFF